MAKVFRPPIRAGAIANILVCAEAPLAAAAEAIAADMRRSPVIASDETSARLRGKTKWQWVLLSSTAIYHLIARTRAAWVVTVFLPGRQPKVWIADRDGG